MTIDEFNVWLEYHGSAFPRTRKWIDDAGDVTLEFWGRTLRDTPLASAKAATDSMHAGSLKKPFDIDDTPKAIANGALQLRGPSPQRQTQGPQIVVNNGVREIIDRCKKCRDSGTLHIWQMSAVEAVRDGTFGKQLTRAGTVAACLCREGEAWQHTLPVFDSRTHCEIEHGTHDARDEATLRAFVKQQKRGDRSGDLSAYQYPGAK